MQKENLEKTGEKIAYWFLKTKGYKIIKTNYHTRRGEIDIICQQGKTIIFVEVKTRSTLSGGYPEEAVTPSKLKKLQMAIDQYLQTQAGSFKAVRIDVISINFTNKFMPEIKHFKNIDAC